MDEEIVKQNLSFLCDEYGFKYLTKNYKDLENYCGYDEVYCYYNDNGVFVITYDIRDGIDFMRIDSIDNLLTCLCWSSGHDISIYKYEPEIWKKDQKKYWLYYPIKKEFATLAKVIRKQIEEKGEFFGIKV